MIDLRDRVRLSAGVHLTAEGLYDEVRGETFELNGTGRLIAACADGRRLGEVADVAASRFGVEIEVVRADAREFCRSLNERFLLDVRSSWHAAAAGMLAATVRGLPAGALPRPSRRRAAIATDRAIAAVSSTSRALASRALAVAAVSAAVSAAVLAALGAPVLETPILLGAGAGLALLAHEGGHAAALRGVPCCLCLAGTAVFLLHRPLPARRRGLVAVAGPLAAAAGGAAALAVAAALGLVGLGVAALVPLSHVLALTVGGRDGRVACGLS